MILTSPYYHYSWKSGIHEVVRVGTFCNAGMRTVKNERNRKIKSNTCNNYKHTFPARRKMSFVSEEPKEKSFRERRESTETKQIEFGNDIIGGCITYNVGSLPLACCINFISASLHNDSDLSPVQSKE
jgi:hypothetical protein